MSANKIFSFATIDAIAPTTTLTTEPTIPDGEGGWFRTAPTISLTADEPATTYYQWDATTGPWTTYLSPFKALEGTHTIYFYSIDSYGNIESPTKSQIIKVDSEKPTAEIKIPAGGEHIRQTVRIIGSAKDNNFKNFSIYYGAGTSPPTWHDIGANPHPSQVDHAELEAWDTGAVLDSIYTLRLNVADESGNETITTRIVTVDNTPPTVSGAASIGYMAFEILFNEANSLETKSAEDVTHYAITPSLGISRAVFKEDGRTVRLLTDIQDATTYTVTVSGVKDRAGNNLAMPNSANFVGLPPASAAPQNLTATAEPEPSRNIILNWSLPPAGEPDYYNVYRYIYPINEENKPLVEVIASHLIGSSTSYADGTGIPGETYYYAITSIDIVEGKEFESPLSNSPEATVPGTENPHIVFSNATNMCVVCHSSHRAEGFFKIERRSTVEETCFVCHDGTGAPNDIQIMYTATDTYAGHKTQTPGMHRPGTQLQCGYCHDPHYAISDNKFLMNKVYLNHDGSTKSLPPNPTRDLRDVCIICHENDVSKPMTKVAGITISHITTDQDISHDMTDSTYCKKCHANIGDAEAAHSPTVVVKAPEAEDTNILGLDMEDNTANAGYVVTHTASTSAIEVILDYYGATGEYLNIGNYSYIIRARVKSSTSTAQLKVAINDTVGSEAPIPEADTWQIIDLGFFTLNGNNDNFRLGLSDSNAGIVDIDRIYFCRI